MNDYITSILSYDADTGLFTWLKDARGKKLAGIEAGCVNSKGYVKIHIKRKAISAHRLAFLFMTGEMPPKTFRSIISTV